MISISGGFQGRGRNTPHVVDGKGLARHLLQEPTRICQRAREGLPPGDETQSAGQERQRAHQCASDQACGSDDHVANVACCSDVIRPDSAATSIRIG